MGGGYRFLNINYFKVTSNTYTNIHKYIHLNMMTSWLRAPQIHYASQGNYNRNVFTI